MVITSFVLLCHFGGRQDGCDKASNSELNSSSCCMWVCCFLIAPEYDIAFWSPSYELGRGPVIVITADNTADVSWTPVVFSPLSLFC